jgi:hypothetical protein
LLALYSSCSTFTMLPVVVSACPLDTCRCRAPCRRQGGDRCD